MSRSSTRRKRQERHAIKAKATVGTMTLTGRATLSLQAAEGQKKERRFEIIAYTGEPLQQSAWDYPVIVDLAGIDAGDGVLPILDNHGPAPYSDESTRSYVVGQSDSATVENGAFVLRGPIMEVNDAAKNIIALADTGYRWQASIGARSMQKDFIAEKNKVQVNGREFEGPVYVSRKTMIREVSFVVLGADPHTSVLVASGDLTMKMTFAEYCKAKGFVEADLNETQKASLKAMYDQEDDDDDEKGDKKDAKAKNPPLDITAKGGDGATSADSVKEHRRQHAAEVRRINTITKICASKPDLECEIDGKKFVILEQAIEAGWDADKTRSTFELEKLRQDRPQAPILAYSPGQPQITEAVIEAAILQHGRCELFNSPEHFGKKHDCAPELIEPAKRGIKARYTDQVQQHAHDIFKGRISLQQALIHAAAANGYNGPQVLRDDGDIKSCLQYLDIRAAGASNLSIANLLSNVLNKFLLEGYLFTETSWRSVCGIRPVKDFKPTKSINLFGDFVFQPMGADGELKNATLNDQAFANQAHTEGRILAITRTHIINDDLGGLTTVPRLMGRGAGLRLNDLIWTLWLNPGKDEGGSTDFWAATHTITGQSAAANYFSGSATNLQSSSLTTAALTFDQQVDPAGKPLGIDGEILLYPPELDTAAHELMNAEFLVYGGSSAAKQPNTNIWKGRFKAVKSRYLSNTAYTGYSTTAWWLLANPELISAMEVCFLNGQEAPTVQTVQALPNQLAIIVRGFMDCGVSMQNFRAGVKSKGAA